MGELLNARGKRTPVFAFRVSAVRFRRGLGLVFLHEAEDKAAPEVVDNYSPNLKKQAFFITNDEFRDRAFALLGCVFKHAF